MLQLGTTPSALAKSLGVVTKLSGNWALELAQQFGWRAILSEILLERSCKSLA